jgi:hypothetical protein
MCLNSMYTYIDNLVYKFYIGSINNGIKRLQYLCPKFYDIAGNIIIAPTLGFGNNMNALY